MHRITILLILVVTSCTPIKKATYRIEESHYALYRQKALIVYGVTANKVMLTNPACTRCYLLKGKDFIQKWETGDTLIIDSNLVDFFSLRFARCKNGIYSVQK